MKLSGVLAVVAGVSSVLGFTPLVAEHMARQLAGRVDVAERDAYELAGRSIHPQSGVPVSGWGTFEQLIDHDNPALGTFAQRWWYSTMYWTGPGSPVLVFNPAEAVAAGLNVSMPTPRRIQGRIARAVGGAVVILEMRNVGTSLPYAEATVEHLSVMTNEQVLNDLAHFARTWTPPFDTTGGSHPSQAPWILNGGSLGGAQAAYMARVGADLVSAQGDNPYWAFYASSAPVQAIEDFWQYFGLIESFTPRNCSADLRAAIAAIDEVLVHGTAAARADLKASFGMAQLGDEDFAKMLSYGPMMMQYNQPSSVNVQGFSYFEQFCDYVENVGPGQKGQNGQKSIPSAAGLENTTLAVAGLAAFFTDFWIPVSPCDNYARPDVAALAALDDPGTLACYQWTNASNPLYHYMGPENAWNRGFYYLYCLEQNQFQDAVPGGRSIVSRLVGVDYNRRVCQAAFPGIERQPAFARRSGVAALNSRMGGWSATAATAPATTLRLIHVNGQKDPWRAASVSSDYRPCGRLASSADADVLVHVIPDGSHCSEFYSDANYDIHAGVQNATDTVIAQLATWVDEFYTSKNLTR